MTKLKNKFALTKIASEYIALLKYTLFSWLNLLFGSKTEQTRGNEPIDSRSCVHCFLWGLWVDQALHYEVVWPTVLGLRPIQVVVVRDPEGRMRDAYLFTTDLQADMSWVIVQFAWRWAIEVLFRSSKQVMDIEAPQHWSQESVEKLAPWVWSMQSVIMVWYITAGYESEEALELREQMGEWDSEWSLRHMIQVLRRAILNVTINPNSGNREQLCEMVKTLKNWANLAA